MIGEYRLPAGPTLLVESTEWLQGVTAGLYVAAGSAEEPAGLEGIAHVLEHVVFKGTEHFTGQEIAEVIESFGGEVNAYTTKEYTCLWGRALPEGLETLLQVLAELFLRPALRHRDLELERRVIAEEHAAWLDSPEDRVVDLLEAEIFRGGPMAHAVLGSPSTIANIRTEDLRRFHARHWRPAEAVLAVSGPVDPAGVARLTERFFVAGQRSPAKPVRAPGTPAEEARPPLHLGQVHVAMGGPARAFGDPLLAAQEILIDELGGGPNSRLFRRLREEEALSYGVYAFHGAYRRRGMWGVYADLSRERWREGIRAIAQEIHAMLARRYAMRHLERLRQSARGQFLLGLDAPFARLERAAVSQLLTGRVPPPEETAERIAQVTGGDLHGLSREFFGSPDFSVAAIDGDGEIFQGDLQTFAPDALDGLEGWR